MPSMQVVDSTADVDVLSPYVPRLLSAWRPTGRDERHMRVPGTLVFVDISGFTRLTERLARKGKVGAEQLSDLLSTTFAALLAEAYEDGADLVKWGGDAVLLLFQGDEHAARAARAAHRMRAHLRVVGHSSTGGMPVALRMSVGIHSGDFDFFLVGDPMIHRELVLSGPAASVTADVEAAAGAGQIALSATTASLLPSRVLGPTSGAGRLLRTAPPRTLTPPTTQRVGGGPAPAETLPPPIAAHLVGGEAEPEHRLITVAFVQFSGADAIARTRGTPALADALDHVVRTVQHACAENDVTFFESDIARDGGKIMLTAGAPRSADHDEERMLRVARHVLDHAGDLALRIGVNRGHVFAGDFGAPFRRTYSVKGDAVNLAARLASRAEPGQALATTAVIDHAQSAFRIRELDPFTVKGKADPVLAVEVGDLLGNRVEDRPSAPLVGRSAELATLLGALDDADRGSGRLLDLVGEAGMGKSRLAAELWTRLAGRRRFLTRCEQYESATPYFPFRRLLREVLDVPVGAGTDQATEVMFRRVSDAAPHLVPWLPLLGVPLDVPLAETRETADLEPQFRKRRLEDLVVELLAAVLTAPTVVVVEDVHLMDPASSDLLERLVADVARRPLLLVTTRRDQPTAFVPERQEAVQSVRVQPLETAAAVELVESVLGDRPATPQLVEELVARGGGNPMFLEALAREVERAGFEATLPESVEALVTSQVDRLRPVDRTVVRCAAVLGAVVDEGALDRLLAEQGLRVPDGALNRMADLLVRSVDGTLRFRNALIRDVAYEALPFRRRRTLHDQVGQALERGTSAPESQCEVLSLHFFHAGRHERAWRYSLMAGERAVTKYAHGEAAAFFERAVQSAAHTDVEPGELAGAYERLADSRWLVGEVQRAADAYAAARRHVAGDPLRLAAIIEKETRIDQRRRRHSLALRRVSTGLRRLEGLPGRRAQVARSLLARRYAQTKLSQSRLREALRWADLAASEAEEAADKDALAQAYEMLNYVYASSGLEEPLPYGRLALQAYVELGNLPRQGHCLNNIAMQDYAAGRWDDSLANLRRASDIFRRIGDTAAESNASYNLVELLVRQRRYAEATALLPGVLRIARAIEDEELVALARREQARCLAADGDVEAGLALLRDVGADFERLGEPAELRGTELVRAELLVQARRVAEAGELLDTLADPGARDVTWHRLSAARHALEGQLDLAYTTLDAALDLARGQANRHEEGLVLLAMADLAEREGHADAALLRRARSTLDELGVS